MKPTPHKSQMINRNKTRLKSNYSPRLRKFSPELQDIFFELFAKTGNPNAAAKAVGIRMTAVRRYRRSSIQFAERWAEAQEKAASTLYDEAYRRGVTGVMDPVYYQGEIVGHKLKYSDACLLALLRAYHEDFKPRLQGEVEAPDGSTIRFIVEVPTVDPCSEDWEKEFGTEQTPAIDVQSTSKD